MLRIALTGGIAAGKSTVSAQLRALGATVIDYDELAHRVVAPGTEGLAAVVARFGSSVLHSDGSLDRRKLASLVFDDGHCSGGGARADLEAIVHPAVFRAALAAEAQAVARDPAAVVVHDVPLLVEQHLATGIPTLAGGKAPFAAVVLVEAPAQLRVARLIAERGLDCRAASARVAAQADDATRRAVADYVLDGSGDVTHLSAQVTELWQLIHSLNQQCGRT